MNLGIFITTYNRPEYLFLCLESLKRVSFPKGTKLLFVDDASDDQKTCDLINEFQLPGVEILYHQFPGNGGIKRSIKFGYEYLFQTCDIVTNLDSDAVVHYEFGSWFHKIIEINTAHNYLYSAFNSSNKEQNPVLGAMHGEQLQLRQFCNGINMIFSRNGYESYCLKTLNNPVGNWDHETSKLTKGCVVPEKSLIQHIGLTTSMGHGDNPDMAQGFSLKTLKDVTLFGIDCNDPKGIKRAGDICQMFFEFGDVKIITDKLFDGYKGYSEFCIKELYKYVPTSHVLLIHPDGYIQNPFAWDDEFLKYDYIGATWWYKDSKNVGNGGFSLRSKKLLEILANDEHVNDFHPEDDKICRKYRPYLEQKYGIKFAPEELANRFSIEAYNTPDNDYKGQFGFHGYHVKGLIFPPLPKVGTVKPVKVIGKPQRPINKPYPKHMKL